MLCISFSKDVSTSASTTTVTQPDMWLENIRKYQELQRKNTPIDPNKALQPILDLLPEAIYASTTAVKWPDMKWFEKNIQKAQNIMDDFGDITGAIATRST